MMKKENGFDDGLCHDTDSGISEVIPGKAKMSAKSGTLEKSSRKGLGGSKERILEEIDSEGIKSIG